MGGILGKRNQEPHTVFSYFRQSLINSRLWAKLNENTIIKVKTGVGESERVNVGAVVGQGTIGGALVIKAVLDEGVKEHFEPGNEDKLNYGKLPL